MAGSIHRVIDRHSRAYSRGSDLIVADFSTTGPVERAASEIVLLDAMQAYFAYEMHTFCGIPSITLEGTATGLGSDCSPDRAIRAIDLDWWVDALRPILDQFVAAANGIIDRQFWGLYLQMGRQQRKRRRAVREWLGLEALSLSESRDRPFSWRATTRTIALP